MNRDENAGKSDQATTSPSLAHEVALGALPIEIISAGEAAPVDTQGSVDAAVCRATRNKRQWDRKTLAAACGAARPAVERDLRSRGRAFTAKDVKNATRVRVQGYADRYGVALPPKVVVGKTALEAVAGDICGSFSLPWTMFMPPQVQLAAKAAQEGSPHAQSWLKKYLNIGKTAPAKIPTAPATPAAAAAAPSPAPALAAAKPPAAPAVDSAGSSDSLGSGDSLGAFMHKLNPFYWLKSPEERQLVDAEKQAWIDNADLQKKIAKRDVVLKQGERAVDAKQAVAAAQARSAEIETQLKAIHSQLSGACGSGARGTSASGGIQEIMGASKKPNPYDSLPNPFGEDVPEYDASPVLKKVQKARQLNADNASDLTTIAAKMQMNQPLSPEETSRILLLLSRNEQLHEFRKSLVNGEIYKTNPSAAQIQKHVVLGAVKAMTPSEQQMMAQIVSLSKTGNPNAVKALAALKAQGYAATMGAAGPAAKIPGRTLTLTEQQKLAQIVALAKTGNPNAQKALQVLQAQGQTVVVGGTMGFGISDAWKIATLPVRGALAVTNWTARKLGITKGGGSASPEQVRLSRLKAAANRRKAAQARARAADSQSEAEYRAAQAVADAADAEADANEAEATAKEAAMLTAEAEYLPGQVAQADDSSTTAQGDDALGAVAPVITPLPPTPDTPSTTNLKVARRALVARKNPRAAKILAASETNTPEGIRLKASMQLYKAAQNRKSKERKAVAVMVAKAKKGDKQALADVRALQAAGLAVKAERSAGRRVAAVAAYRATTAKVKATQKRLEIAAADKLTRASRRHQLAKVAKIERRAAAGDKPCQKIIKHQVDKARKGDPGARKAVAALALAKHVRTSETSPREKRNLKKASRLVKKVGRGDKTALAQVRVYEAAAKHGNPNAKRAMKRVRTAAAVEHAVKTGMIVLPAVVVTSEIALRREQAKKKENERKIALAEKRLAKGKGTREEVMAAAKAASDSGDKAKGAELAAEAAKLPSAGEELRRVAAVTAAADAGNLANQAKIARAEQAAATGDPAGVAAMGSLAAVKAMDQVSKGRDIDPQMKEAVRDVEAAQAGDPAALQKIAAAQTQAAAGVPTAVKYAVYATGAAAVGRALADNPEAKDQWRQKAGLKSLSTENEDVKVVNAEVVTTSPMSSLPDQPLPPVRGIWGVIKASLQAVGLATRDPFANYREAVASRGRRALPAADTAGTDNPDDVRTKQAKLLQKIKNEISSKNEELTRVNKNIARDNKEAGINQPLLNLADYPLLITDTEYTKLLPPYRVIVDSFMKQGQVMKYSSYNPKLATYFLIIEGRPDLPVYSTLGSALPPREQRIMADALKNKSITRDDFELLSSLETNPGETEKALRGAGVKIVSFGPTAVRGEARKKPLKKDEPSEIDALNELQDPSVKAAIDARRVKVATSLGAEQAADDPKLKEAVASTRTKLTALVNAATTGDRKAQAKWQSLQATYKQDVAKAAKGDNGAKVRVAILKGTGHFAE